MNMTMEGKNDMIEVADGTRQIRFEGEKLARSSSYSPGKVRWIEFNLYKTLAGSFVLHRIGASRQIHTSKCNTVVRNKIKEAPVESIELDNATICHACQLEGDQGYSSVIYPEVPRHWASVSESAESVVDNLYKVDYTGNRYLTDVAKRLLEDASSVDTSIADAYLTEYID